MASFQDKIGWKRLKKRKIKIIVSFRSNPTRNTKFKKKIAKNFKKIKNTIMDLFQAKTGWRRMRKRENKNYRSVPTRLLIENSKKNSKNIQKIKKYHCGFSSRQNRLEKAEKEKNKNYRFVLFQPNA